jgi:hypothetical protein
MPSTTAQKLKIKEGFTLLSFHAPNNFQKQLQPLPASVKISATAKKYDQVHWFVENKAQLEKELDTILTLIKDEVTCWIYYPKGTSKMQTDLTRDKGWDALLRHNDKLTWINLISFDETWSVFGCRLKTEADMRKAAQPKQRPIFEYIDAKTKTIRLPGDLEDALKNNKKQESFFNALSFTNRKEYIEWIVTSKREETRIQRVKATIEKLGQEWKNPANL